MTTVLEEQVSVPADADADLVFVSGPREGSDSDHLEGLVSVVLDLPVEAVELGAARVDVLAGGHPPFVIAAQHLPKDALVVVGLAPGLAFDEVLAHSTIHVEGFEILHLHVP